MSLWPLLPRRDIVGRRCVTVNCNRNDINGEPLNMGRGVIRASSHADPSAQDEKVLVEFDSSSDWTGRQWVAIHSQFDVFLVEDKLVGVISHAGTPGIYQPVLTFKTIVDKINYSSSNNFHLVESLTPDRTLNFVAESNIVHLKEEDVRRMCDSAATNDWVCARSWLSFQYGQHVLLSSPSRGINCRVKVYNICSNSQWYNGRIITANENTKSMTILDDNGEDHVENAALVQMELDNRDFSITSKVTSGIVSKPRSRTSTEEHPMAKQPKLDASGTEVDSPLKSPSSTSQGLARQLVAMTGATSEYNSCTTRPLQVDPGSRNLFSAIMTPKRENQPTGTPVVFAITTNPLPVSKSGAPIMPASATATTSVLATSHSPPSNQDSSKIKTLLGYRPSVMFVIPAPGPTSPSGTTSVAPTPGSCPTNAQFAGSPGNQHGPGEATGSARLVQQNAVLRLPAGVEYIGTIPLQIRNRPNNPRFFTPGMTASEVPVTAAKIHGQGTGGELSNGGKQQSGQTSAVHGFQTSESTGREVQMQSPVVRLHVAPGTPGKNQPMMSPVRGQGVGNASGLQQVQTPAGMPGVPRANFAQQMQSPGRKLGVQSGDEVQQMQGQIRMQGMQSAGGVQQIQDPSRMQIVQTTSGLQNSCRMLGVQTTSAVHQVQNPGRFQGVQNTSLVRQILCQGRMQIVQTTTGLQQTQSTSRMQGLQNLSALQQMLSSSRLQGVQNASGLQSPGRMPGVQTTSGVLQVQSPSTLQGVQTASGLQSPGRMPGVQNTSGVQQMHSPSRMPGVPTTSGVQQMQSPSMLQGVQTGLQSPGRMPEVQTTNGVQQMQSPSTLPGVQTSSELQSPGRMPGVLTTTSGVQRMHSPSRMPGVPTTNGVQQMQSPTLLHGVQTRLQSPGRMPGVQTTSGVQQMQNPSRMPGVQTASGVQQMQSPTLLHGVQTRLQSPGRMPGVQTTSGVQQMQNPSRMPGVQTTSGVEQMQSHVRMPGVQNASLNQPHPVRMQSTNENQPCAVRNQELQGSVGIQQMPGPGRFQGVQSASGNQQSALQFKGVQNARGIQQRPRNPQVRSNASGIQQMPNLLNSGPGPPGQFTAKRMPIQSRLQLTQDQEQATSLQKPNSAQRGRRQNVPGLQQVQSATANALRLPVAPATRGFRGQTLASPRGPRNQTRSLRPNIASTLRQSLVGVKSQASSQEIVHQVVESALRKYGLEMNCRMNRGTQRFDAVSARSSVSSLSSPSESFDSVPRSGDSQAARQDGSGPLSRQNSGHHISTTEPFTSNSLEVSETIDSKPNDSHSSLTATTACDTKYLAMNSSSSTDSLGSSVPAQGNQTCRAQQKSKVSKSRVYYYDTKSDSRMGSIEIVRGKRKASPLSKTKIINAKHRTMPQETSTQQPSSNSSQMTSSDLLPVSKSETPSQGLKAVVTTCKLEGTQATKNVSSASAGVNSNFRLPASSPAIARVGEGMPKMWFEEYEDELQDLSRILDMLKRLDSTKCHQIQDSTGNKMPNPKQLSNQMNNPATAHPPENQHSAVTPSQRKSDCETKVKQLLAQLCTLGLKFENPSFALSKKKLNSVSELSNGFRTCIQDKSCLSIPPPLLKCRECKSVCNYPSKLSQVLCRFHAFRRLTLTGKGAYVSSGFSSPTDADAVEISLWMPLLPIVNPQIDVEMAKYIIKNVGNRFCELVEQEKEAMSWISSNGDVAWKRAVNGVREMCDVCNTTLFNVHWVCRKCGYVVCLDCYRTKTHKCTRCHEDVNCATCDRGFLKWAKCSINRQPHDPKEMMLTQIIPSDVLWVVGRMIHDIRKTWHISENCPCGEDRILELSEEPSALEQVNRVTQSDDKVNDSNHCEGLGSGGTEPPGHKEDSKDKLNDDSSQKAGSEVELQSTNKSAVKSNSRTVKRQGPPTLREFLLEKNSGFNGAKLERPPVSSYKNLDDVFRRVMKDKLSHVVSKASPRPSPDSSLMTTDVTSTPVGPISSSPQEVAHVWLDNGRLLQLLEPRNPDNIKKFQEVWRKGQPVLVSNCDQYITKNLWLPEVFAEEFGDMENDLVDCSHKVVLIGHQMRHFWQGFESVKARLKDSEGKPMILKLKDWPPMEDFSEMLPSRFKDLLQGLPLPEYTDRSGVFNLASRLPEFFVRPDLGPKMYNAYGSALHPLVGSTNLHLDVSDAVNLILYVGIAMDDTEDHEAAAIDAMRQAGCCDVTMARITEHGHKPGALWHIFDAKDSDKIRDLLTKVGLEIGEPVEAHHDPIHDQSWYLDEKLRERLLREYSVQGYTLVQCVGDAIFIPAGAPHQVRNLHSCIKAAEDFVSPENLSHCFKMTQEFRHLSDTHSNHEDKLQVKNIIYHAVKDAIAVLQNSKPESE